MFRENITILISNLYNKFLAKSKSKKLDKENLLEILSRNNWIWGE